MGTETNAAIAIGDRAPTFALPDQDGATVRSEDLLGEWVVLYFYPRDDTPGCTTQACDFTAAREPLAELGARVLGCSPDTPESHAAFVGKHRLGITLLSDPGRDVMRAYGAWGEKVLYGKRSVGAIRSTVLIDPAGFVAHRWGRVAAKGHAEAVRKKLARLVEQAGTQK